MANSNNSGRKFSPPSGKLHAPLGPGGRVGGVHSPGAAAPKKPTAKMAKR